jgi:uncharacterized membrane protein YedE/YeeE
MGALGAVLLGVLFGAGLALSGMSQPGKVIGFLDVTGNWDPSLAFVMGGAVGIFAPLFALIARRGGPGYGSLRLTTQRPVDAPLVVGAAIFGVGWGLAGYCPGPGITAAGAGRLEALSFFAAMLAGVLLFQLRARRTNRPPAGAARQAPAS